MALKLPIVEPNNVVELVPILLGVVKIASVAHCHCIEPVLPLKVILAGELPLQMV